MADKIKNFRDLNIWKNGIEIVKNIYNITKKLPKEELYVLTSQSRRSAISIPSNIAEGFNRFHNKEYIQFLYIALGSCAELETQLEILINLKHIPEKEIKDIIEKIELLSKMITSLIKKLK